MRQIVVSDEEYERYRQEAEERDMTVEELVREAMDRQRRERDPDSR
jgi:hypothetical protein